MSMTVERKKYLEVNMWNKIKDKIKWVGISLIIGCLFYLNSQTDSQLKDRIIQLELESSHYRTDIIGLESDIDAFGITMIFHRNEIDIANKLFQKDLVEDVEHTLGMMESKLKILEEHFESFEIEYDIKENLLRGKLVTLFDISDTLRVDDKKGRQTLQEQIDQLRLEFEELIQKLEEHKRTKDIFQ